MRSAKLVAKSLREATMRSAMLHRILASRLRASRATHRNFALRIVTSRYASQLREATSQLRNFAKRVCKESRVLSNEYYIKCACAVCAWVAGVRKGRSGKIARPIRSRISFYCNSRSSRRHQVLSYHVVCLSLASLQA